MTPTLYVLLLAASSTGAVACLGVAYAQYYQPHAGNKKLALGMLLALLFIYILTHPQAV